MGVVVAKPLHFEVGTVFSLCNALWPPMFAQRRKSKASLVEVVNLIGTAGHCQEPYTVELFTRLILEILILNKSINGSVESD